MVEKRNEYYREFYNSASSYWASVYKADESELSIYAIHFRQRREIVLGMIRQLGLPQGARALDAGCGPGAYLNPLLDMGFEVSAMDQSDKMVEEARLGLDQRYASRVTFKTGKLESVPFESERFDLATNIAVLMYVEDGAQAVAELHRVLKPGGTLIITVDNRRDFADMIDLPMRLCRLWSRLRRSPAKRGVAAGAPQQERPVAARSYSPAELKGMLAKAGFAIDEETSIGFAPLLLNGRRFLSNRADLVADHLLQFLRWVPGLRLTGYTYVCRCHRV